MSSSYAIGGQEFSQQVYDIKNQIEAISYSGKAFAITTLVASVATAFFAILSATFVGASLILLLNIPIALLSADILFALNAASGFTAKQIDKVATQCFDEGKYKTKDVWAKLTQLALENTYVLHHLIKKEENSTSSSTEQYSSSYDCPSYDCGSYSHSATGTRECVDSDY